MNMTVCVRIVIASLSIVLIASQALWAQQAPSAARSAPGVQTGQSTPGKRDSQSRADAFRGDTNDAGLANREKALQDLEVVIESARRFDRTPTADFVVVTEPRGVYTRVELVPAASSASRAGDAKTAGTIRFFLQGQEREKVDLSAGKYVIRFAFWLPGMPYPIDYPKTTEFEIDEGERATLTISREALSAVRAWLKEISKRDRKDQPKGEAEREDSGESRRTGE